MPKMKLSIKVAVLLGLLIAGYSVARTIQINKADEVVDAFFADFSSDSAPGFQVHVRKVDQGEIQALSILQRHQTALHNFAYSEFKPNLSILLSRAEVPVSWHLTIVLTRGGSGWQISHLEEFTPKDKNA